MLNEAKRNVPSGFTSGFPFTNTSSAASKVAFNVSISSRVSSGIFVQEKNPAFKTAEIDSLLESIK